MINAICLAVSQERSSTSALRLRTYSNIGMKSVQEQGQPAVVAIALQIMAAVRKVGGQAEPVSRINAFVTFIY